MPEGKAPGAVWRGNVHGGMLPWAKVYCIVGCHCFYLTENILGRAAWKGSVNALNSVLCIHT